MSDRFDVASIEERARTAGYRDGLIELFAATVLVVIAIMWVASPGLVGIAAAFIVLYGWKVVERVKERLTYPRIGYFQERPEAPDTTARGMLIFMAFSFALMIIAVVITGGISDAASWRRAAPIMSGISLAGGFWYMGDRSSFVRHKVIAVYSVVTGVLLWLVGTGESYETIVWHLLAVAAPLAALGTWGLVHFLRTHPVQDASSDG
jgi:hypothetical protein